MESDNTEDYSPLDIVGNKGKYPVDTYQNAFNAGFNQVQAPKQISQLGDDDLKSMLSAPLSGEEVALKIAELNKNNVKLSPNNISFEEFDAYNDWRQKQHFSFMGGVADGFAQAGKDMVGGVWDAATDYKKLALAGGLSLAAGPAVGFGVAYGSSLVEGFARGTRDLGGLFVMAANHPDSPIYRLMVNPSGDKKQLYQDFFDLADWNHKSEQIMSGKSNALMPDRASYEKLFGKAFGDQIDDFIGVNQGLATASSYVLDPTLFLSLGSSSAVKGGAKVATTAAAAALKAGHAGEAVAHGVAARAATNATKANILNSMGRAMRTASDFVTKPVENVAKKIEKVATDVLGARANLGPTSLRLARPKITKAPTSFAHGVLGAAGVYSLFNIPYGAAITSAYAGAKAVGMLGDILESVGKNTAKNGFIEGAEIAAGQLTKAGRPLAGSIAKTIAGTGVVHEYMKDLSKVMAHGALYGGVIGYLAGGEEGAAGGIGTGLFLGAAGHNVALAQGTLSGRFAKYNLAKEFDNHVAYLKESGNILKSERIKQFEQRVLAQDGEEGLARFHARVMSAEKSKNLTVAYMTVSDMWKALQSDPEYVITNKDGSKMLTPLGEALQANINESIKAGFTKESLATGEVNGGGGTAWNGVFMEIDKDGKVVPATQITYKDKASGKHHIIINIDAMNFVRDKDGNFIKRTEVSPNRAADKNRVQKSTRFSDLASANEEQRIKWGSEIDQNHEYIARSILSQEIDKLDADVVSEAKAGNFTKLKERILKPYIDKYGLGDSDVASIFKEITDIKDNFDKHYVSSSVADENLKDARFRKHNLKKKLVMETLASLVSQPDENKRQSGIKDAETIAKTGDAQASYNKVKKPWVNNSYAPEHDGLYTSAVHKEVLSRLQQIGKAKDIPKTISRDIYQGSFSTNSIVSELYHHINRVQRKAEIGNEITTVVRNWLIGDTNQEGWAFKDRAGAVDFMRKVYDKNARTRDAETRLRWKSGIEEFEKTGTMTENTASAMVDFMEELGDTMFVGWEAGKPFDFAYEGGDLGIARGLLENIKDKFAQYVLREATNMGADVDTRQGYNDWFNKAKNGGKFRFDPVIEKAFTDLVRIHHEKGMRNNGVTKTEISKMSSEQMLKHAQIYGFEDKLKKNPDGTYSFKSDYEYNAEQHEKGRQFLFQVAEAAEKDPSVLDGLDVFVTDSTGREANAEFESQVNDSFAETSTLDTIGSKRGFLYQSADSNFDTVGVGLDDIKKAQRDKAVKDGIYKETNSSTYGNRGRPRTHTTGKLKMNLLQAIEQGKTVIFKGIPSSKAFAILEKHISKTERRNVAMIAPLIVDGGRTKANVASGNYHGWSQKQHGGETLRRDKINPLTGITDEFEPRAINFVPYDMELRISLKNKTNPTQNYSSPHFQFNVQCYDVDALNRRMHSLWNNNPELRGAYNHINQFISHVYETVDHYSAYRQIPATKFFGSHEYAVQKRKYVMAAIGAVPNREMKSRFSIAEADWHETQMSKAGIEGDTANHPWTALVLGNLSHVNLVEGEGNQLRMTEKVYRRSMVPTPDEVGNSMYYDKSGKEAMYQSPDEPINIDSENLDDFNQSVNGGKLSRKQLVKQLSSPNKLVKELEKLPQFQPRKQQVFFQSADSLGASNEAEGKFLKSNYQLAVSNGDIFEAESVKRFVRSTGDKAMVVRHTLEEHINSGGNPQTYLSMFETGKPTVAVATHGTNNKLALITKSIGTKVGDMEKIKQGKLSIFDSLSRDSASRDWDAPAPRGATGAVNLKSSSQFQLRALLSFKNPLVLDNMRRDLSVKIRERESKLALSGLLDKDAVASLAESAKQLGHDGIIFIDGKKENAYDTENVRFLPLESDKQIAIIDDTLGQDRVPRNSGYEEGAVSSNGAMYQSADLPEERALPKGAFGENNPETVKISRGFKQAQGINAGDGKFIVKLNEGKSFRIGLEYDRMKHNPNDPLVKKSYEQFIKETILQMRELQSQGYTAELNFSNEDPYGSSQNVVKSIRENKHLKVFSTDAGFGTNPDGTSKTITDADIKDNPLLAMSEFKDVNGKPMRINDVFRFVHDIFGHSERGNSFGPLGEENAWDVHSRMYSNLARRAMTSETRGQNSWVNFVNEKNKKIYQVRSEARRLRSEGKIAEADVLVNSVKGEDVYADQKIGLLPEWASKLDEEMTPIEKEVYGVHETVEGKHGVYQSGDLGPEAGGIPELEYTGATPQTREAVATADAMLQYANFYREQLEKRQRGEIASDMALNMILNKWHKDNKTTQTSTSWSRLPIGEGKYVNVAEFNAEHKQSHIISLIREDKNYKQDMAGLSQKETLKEKRQRLLDEINAIEDPKARISARRKFIRDIGKRNIQRTIEYIDSLEGEQLETEQERIGQVVDLKRKPKTYEEANVENVKDIKKEKDIEKIMVQMNRENRAEIALGRPAMYAENEIRQLAEFEYENRLKNEDGGVGEAEAEADAFKSGEITKEEAEQLAEQKGGIKGKSAEDSKLTWQPEPPKSVAEYIHEITKEEAERAERGEDNGIILSDTEIEELATKLHESNKDAYEAWQKESKNKEKEEKQKSVPRSLHQFAKAYEGTYFAMDPNKAESEGLQPIKWVHEGIIYDGFEKDVMSKLKNEKKKNPSDIVPLYPEDMQKFLEDTQAKLDELKSEDYNIRGLSALVALMQMWGYKINPSIRDIHFTPETGKVEVPEGMRSDEAKRYIAERRGHLITSMSEEAVVTDALDNVPDFLDDVKSIYLKALGNSTDGVAENEVRLAGASGSTDLGSQFHSLIKIEVKLESEFGEKMKKELESEFGEKYPATSEDLYFTNKEDWVQDKYNNFNWKKPPAQYAEAINAMRESGWEEKLIRKTVRDMFAEEWKGEGKHIINSFFISEKNKGRGPSVEKNIRERLKERNEQLKMSGQVALMLTDDQIKIAARAAVLPLRRKFAEFIFTKANEAIQAEATRVEHEERTRKQTPSEIQAERRARQVASATDTEQYSQPIGPQFEQPAPKPEPVAKTEPAKPDLAVEETEDAALAQQISNYQNRASGGTTPIQPPAKVETPKPKTTVEPPKAVADYKKPIGPQQPKPVAEKNWIARKDKPSEVVNKEKTGAIEKLSENTYKLWRILKNGSREQIGYFKTYEEAKAAFADKEKTIATPQDEARAKPVPKTKLEKTVKKIDDTTNATQTIKTEKVESPAEVGVKHAQVIQTGVIGAGTPEVAQAVSAVLAIKDDFTLSPASANDTKGAYYSANKRYVAEPIKGGKAYRVTMLDHISPYDDKPLPKTLVSIVGTLEQAQLAIREHAFYQRRLFEMNPQKFSSGQIAQKLQAEAPVLTPQQTQQIATQVAQSAQQQPLPPVTNPRVKAETHPNFNNILRGLQGLGIPDPIIKQLTIEAIDKLGVNAPMIDVVRTVLNLSQGRALQVAQANQTHAATANTHQGQVTPQVASQVVIMPTDGGVKDATGRSIPKPPPVFTGEVPKIPPHLVPRAGAAELAAIQQLSTFSQFSSAFSLPNGTKVNGVSFRNAFGYVIQQSGIGRWRLYSPAANLLSVVDNEQEAVDKLLKHYYSKK
jgi:hypothetical protein